MSNAQLREFEQCPRAGLRDSLKDNYEQVYIQF